MVMPQIDPKESEAKLILDAVEGKYISKLQERGILPEMLIVWGEVLDFIYGHIRKYDEEPTISTVKLAYPEISGYVATGEDIDFLIDLTLENYKRKQVEELLETAADFNIQSPGKAASYLLSTIPSIDKELAGKTVYLDSNPEERLLRFLKKKNDLESGKRIGLRTGVSELDRELLSWVDGDLIIVIGPPEVGKSWLLLRTCLATYMAGERILFISPEMSEEEVELRWHTMYGRELGYQFSNEALMFGTLKDIEKYKEFLARTCDRNDFILVDSVEGGGVTVAKIEGLVKDYAPKLIAIDSLALMTASDGTPAISWTGMLDVVYALKYLATRTKSVIATTSVSTGETFGRETPAEMSEIGLSRNVMYAADIALSLAVSKDKKKRNLRVIKKRKGRSIVGIFQMHFDPDVGAVG